MTHSRRKTLALGGGALVSFALGAAAPRTLRAQSGVLVGERYPTPNGAITVHPVEHASFVMATPGLMIYNDPVGGAAAYDGLPPPELILITHEHGDHFDVDTLIGLVGPQTRLVTNPAVFAMLPADLRTRATAIANGEGATVREVSIDAIPAYNLTADRLQYHPEGRDNGYVLGVDGMRVYIAGDTEDVPEMRALTGIDIAFLPMNLPYTMSVEQATDAAAAFAPRIVYPYHYGDSDIDRFATLVGEADVETQVIRGQWYA